MGRDPCARMGAAEGSVAETHAAPAGPAGRLPAGPAFPPGARARTGRQEARSRSHAAGGGCGGGSGDGSVPRAHMSRVRESTRGARMGGRGRAEAEGPGPGALPRVRIEGRSKRETTGDSRPEGPGAISPAGCRGGDLKGGGRREASASGHRREGGRRAEPRGAHGRLRGDATSPAGCRATRAGRARARRGERTREAPLPALPADAGRARDGARTNPAGCSSGGVRAGGGVRGPYALSPPLPSIQHFRVKMCDKTGEHAAVPARSGTIFCA